jgi:cytoskeleton protein RodZ
VRSYARLLKLDPEPLLQRVAGHFEVPDSNRLAARYHQPVPFSDGGRKSTFVYLGLSAGVLVLVGAVAYGWHQERLAAGKSNETAVAKAPSSEMKPRAAPVPVQAAAAPVAVAPERTKSVIALAVPPAPALEPEKPKVVAPEKPRAVGAGPHRLVVRTEGEAWIEIKDAADRMLVSSLNPPGSERVVRGKPPYSLVIGNASNVTVLYDDKPIDLAPHTRQDVARLTVP